MNYLFKLIDFISANFTVWLMTNFMQQSASSEADSLSAN
jgi:hypothetical protein